MLHYPDRTLYVLSGASSVSLFSFANAMVLPTQIACASISLVFLLRKGIVKLFLKTMVRKRRNNRKIVLLDRSKLNSIEKKIISKALADTRSVIKSLH